MESAVSSWRASRRMRLEFEASLFPYVHRHAAASNTSHASIAYMAERPCIGSGSHRAARQGMDGMQSREGGEHKVGDFALHGAERGEHVRKATDAPNCAHACVLKRLCGRGGQSCARSECGGLRCIKKLGVEWASAMSGCAAAGCGPPAAYTVPKRAWAAWPVGAAWGAAAWWGVWWGMWPVGWLAPVLRRPAPRAGRALREWSSAWVWRAALR